MLATRCNPSGTIAPCIPHGRLPLNTNAYFKGDWRVEERVSDHILTWKLTWNWINIIAPLRLCESLSTHCERHAWDEVEGCSTCVCWLIWHESKYRWGLIRVHRIRQVVGFLVFYDAILPSVKWIEMSIKLIVTPASPETFSVGLCVYARSPERLQENWMYALIHW